MGVHTCTEARGQVLMMTIDEKKMQEGQHLESAVLVVPPLATPAAWDARPRIWAALRTPKERLSCRDPSGSS